MQRWPGLKPIGHNVRVLRISGTVSTTHPVGAKLVAFPWLLPHLVYEGRTLSTLRLSTIISLDCLFFLLVALIRHFLGSYEAVSCISSQLLIHKTFR